MAFRARLTPQFLWASLQAIEKYFKCIHVLNRVPLPKQRGLGHNLSALYDLTTRECFDVRLSEGSKKLIEHLDNYGRFRYLEIPWHVLGYERFDLDRAVWEIRRYCRVFPGNTRQEELAGIEHSAAHPPHRFRLEGGLLEKILTDKKHPARRALIWQNYHFASRTRKRVRVGGMHFENAPLSLYPEMLDDVCKYAYLPQAVVEAYKKDLAARVKDGSVRVLLP